MEIYVGNLAYATTDDGLKAAFAQFGEVTAVRVVTDRMTGRSKGFGFVTPKTIKEMQADVEVLAPLSNQRITHLLTDLRKAGTVARTYVKKVAYFSIGTEDPTDVESND